MKFELKELKSLCEDSFDFLLKNTDLLSDTNKLKLQNALPFYILGQLYEAGNTFNSAMEKSTLKFKSEKDEKYIKELFVNFNSLCTNKRNLVRQVYTISADYVNDIISDLTSRNSILFSIGLKSDFIDRHTAYMLYRMQEMSK